MRRMIRMAVIPVVAFASACASPPEQAPEVQQIRVFSAGSLQRALAPIAEAYTEATGQEVSIEVGTTPVMTERLEAGDMFDVVIATPELINAAAGRGQVDASTGQLVGRVGIGIGVRAGIDAPQLVTVDDLKAFLLSADTVAYNQGSSGVYTRSMIESIGIADQLESKTTQYANGGQVVTHVLEGTGRDVGVAPLPEIRANEANGMQTVRLPDAVQNYTSYQAVVRTGAGESAADFVRYLVAPAARQTFIATGVE